MPCCASLVRAAVPSSFDQSYHLLKLRNNGGLMIPSEGTVKVVRAAERVLRQNTAGQGVSVSLLNHFVRAEIGLEQGWAFIFHGGPHEKLIRLLWARHK